MVLKTQSNFPVLTLKACIKPGAASEDSESRKGMMILSSKIVPGEEEITNLSFADDPNPLLKLTFPLFPKVFIKAPVDAFKAYNKFPCEKKIRSSSQFFFHFLLRYLKFVRVDWKMPRMVALRTFSLSVSSVSSPRTTTSVRLQN